MRTLERFRYHGIALMQIVDHECFTALNRASADYGHYIINTDKQVFAKYRTNRRSPWQFIFGAHEIQRLAAAVASGDDVYICLVCGTTTVCVLDDSEAQEVLDLASPADQWISVEVPRGGSCHVRGSSGNLRRTVPHSAFPSKVFA